MRMTRTAPRPMVGLTAAAVVGVALLGACSPPSAATAGDGTKAKVTGSAATSESAEHTRSPLEELWSDVYGADLPDQGDDAVNADATALDEAIAECMKDQGFEYTPVDFTKIDIGMPVIDEEDTKTREYAEKYGYGVLQGPWMDEPTESGDEAEALLDPNAEYKASMTDLERQAFEEALNGTGAMDPSADGELLTEGGVPPVEEQGCVGKATAEVWNEDDDEPHAEPSEALTAFNVDLQTLYQDQETAPDIVKLNEKWAACMAEAGIDRFSNPNETWDYFNEKANAVWDDVAPDATAPAEADPAALEEERKTAVADFDCKERTSYVDTRDEVTFALEQAFIDSHKDLIETIKAEWEQQRK